MFLGQLRHMMSSDEDEKWQTQRSSDQQKSSDADEFMKTPEVKDFVSKWAAKKKDGEQIYTKRGIVALLRALFQVPGLKSNKDVLALGNEVLTKLGGMDGLQGFLFGWKAKSEGIMRGLKGILGGK